MSSIFCCLKRKPARAHADGSSTDNNPDEVGADQFISDTFQRLVADPNDQDQQQKLSTQFSTHPAAVFTTLREQAAQLLPSLGPQPTTVSSLANPPLPDTSPDWTNSIGTQRCTPLRKTKPQSLADLVSTITAARASNHRVRAVGSGHAFSDVARTDGAVLINPVLLNDVRPVDAGALREGVDATTLVRVQAGITVRSLKVELENRGLALVNMGGYDGQTISGTLSTGTHGSGIGFGPLASFARAVVLVAESGVVYWVEPERGITEPGRWAGSVDGVAAVLKQDDEWFRAVQVAMGCLGVVYEYVLEVTEAFAVRELRSSTTWKEVREELKPELWAPVPPVVSAVDHFELVLNPYNRWFRNACVKVERTRLPGNTPSSGQRQDWLSALLEQVAIQKAPDLVAFLTNVPFISPLVIDQAIMTLVYKEPYIDKSYNVFSLGAANEIKGMALELHCDAKQCVPTIDKLLDVFQEQALRYMWYMAGPLGIRFVAPSDAFLAPEAGRMTCTIELAMLVGLKTGEDLARHVKERMCTKDGSSVRVHWGLDLDFATGEDLRAWYPDFGRWYEVYKGLNSTGMFNNKFTDRMGISL